MTENERIERNMDVVMDLLAENTSLTDEQLELLIATADPDSPTAQ